MSFPANCSDFPNLVTPQAFYPQVVATGIELGRYVTVATAGALLWDVLSNMFSDYDILLNHRFTLTALVYAMARLSVILFVLLSAVFQTAPVKYCTIFQQVRMATLVATISTTTLLFHIRLRGVYQMHRLITGAFFFIWLCVVAGATTLLFGGTGENLGLTDYCIDGPSKPYTALAVFFPIFHDTLVFIAISYQLSGNILREATVYRRMKSFFSGKYLPAFTASLLRDGQSYYAITNLSAMILVILMYIKALPIEYHGLFSVPNTFIDKVLWEQMIKLDEINLVRFNVAVSHLIKGLIFIVVKSEELKWALFFHLSYYAYRLSISKREPSMAGVNMFASDAQRRADGTGGFSVNEEMVKLCQQPGFLKEKEGGTKLRHLYQMKSAGFDANMLRQFALWCFLGQAESIKKAVESGSAPDLTATETPYKFGYCTLVIAGAQRGAVGCPGSDHPATLSFLLSSGAPPDAPDIVGYTALHHATQNAAGPTLSLARILLTHGADPNHQNCYGEVPILGAFQTNGIGAIELLMEFGAQMDVADADGITPRGLHLLAGPQVTAAVAKWLRRRTGGHWRTHKQTCLPFDMRHTVTVRPAYEGVTNVIPLADMTRASFGIPSPPPPARNFRGAKVPRMRRDETKQMVIKVQVPWTGGYAPAQAGDMLVYTKKRDFVCRIRPEDGVDVYRRLAQVVHEQGIGRAKAYFSAELKDKDELVIKVGDVLAEQPF
ncbi:hypothetical protein POSPLADRAFT_1067983 [Postia placenta MAD-698-R-SB12]|uniref:Uncharacterized protein n=1 Tax=Postia placenta MAD-698-R-SB12 TaxID=670580 RepID=A0A1X6MKR0_9APHY|nr:hypothetical protein POSPLADRAFT_1067983 [Postia placenta MAD-698-R-SB12]OSX56980.1 hypothetical protein POSPLADRAFT_1067983 [Postia placenta MAD-698-R-SB12]